MKRGDGRVMVALVGVVCVMVGFGLTLLSRGGNEGKASQRVDALPSGFSSASMVASPSPDVSPTDLASPRKLVPDLQPPQIQPTFGPGDSLRSLPWRDQPTSWDPVDSVPLASDPIDRALVSVEQGEPGGPSRIHLLGVDGHWRYVDLPGAGLENSWLSRGSLSSDGTHFAVRTTKRMKIVDLASGLVRSLRVRPGDVGGGEVYWSNTDSNVIFLGSGQDGRGWSPTGFALNLATASHCSAL